MQRIHALDASLVNKIAAGEVIERPASVVKELVENAIDAGASRIDVCLEEGGTTLIRVTDNGSGIGADDLPMAVAPHATSKLQSVEDLFQISTLGFRGEALASIASISRLTIRSRTANCDGGQEIAVDDGRPTMGPCASPVGTSVEVRHLFYNVPARRKFLRNPSTEHAHVTEQLARLALAHPSVAFTSTHNGRATRNLPETVDRRVRIADFYGPELADCLIGVGRTERELRIEALIAPPHQSRTSTKWQYVFLNGRFISDRRIGFAIREAYRGLVENGRYPVVFLFLAAPADHYDVNVHPTKIEVRWRDGGLMQSQVLAVLRETLLSHNLTPALRPGASYVQGEDREPGDLSDDTASTASDAHRLGAREALADYLKSIDPTQARLQFAPPRFGGSGVRPTLQSSYAVKPRAEAPIVPGTAESDHVPGARETPPNPPDWNDAHEGASEPPAAGRVPDGFRSDEPIEGDHSSAIQVHNTYLVAQTDEGIIIVDQHALHERILYEKFRRSILAGPLESQRLLIPETFNASPSQAQAAESQVDFLSRLGIEVVAFGPRQLAVQAFPVLLSNLDIRAFVIDLLDRLAETGGSETDETVVHRVLDMMACKAAVKAGDPLTAEEIQALLAQRYLIDRASNCPHGRPTTLALSTRELEKQFKRV